MQPRIECVRSLLVIVNRKMISVLCRGLHTQGSTTCNCNLCNEMDQKMPYLHSFGALKMATPRSKSTTCQMFSFVKQKDNSIGKDKGVGQVVGFLEKHSSPLDGLAYGVHGESFWRMVPLVQRLRKKIGMLYNPKLIVFRSGLCWADWKADGSIELLHSPNNLGLGLYMYIICFLGSSYG